MENNFRLLRPFFRGLPIIVISMIVAVLVAKKYLTYVTPMYESTTKLKLADIHEGVHNSNLFKDFDVFTTSNKVAAEIEVLKSNVLISKALDSLDFDMEIYRKGKIRTVELYHDSPFRVHASIQDDSLFDRNLALRVLSKSQYQISIPGRPSPVKGTFGELLRVQSSTLLLSLDTNFSNRKPPMKLVDEYEIKFLSRQKLVDKIAKELDIIPIDKDVAVIRISFKSAVPEKAALLVNQLAKSYIQDFIEQIQNRGNNRSLS
jgi:uncharacterized protein involved in exopolysaccharide biosynthesis